MKYSTCVALLCSVLVNNSLADDHNVNKRMDKLKNMYKNKNGTHHVGGKDGATYKNKDGTHTVKMGD